MADVQALADIARRRGIRRIAYFHSDHFEPWGSGATEAAVRGCERFHDLSRRSPYGARQSLFYLTHNVHGLAGPEDGENEVSLPSDGVRFTGFAGRNATDNRRMSEGMRRLVEAGGHEIHLHVHHEGWTRNALGADRPVWQWVQEHSTPEADERRFALFLRVALDTIAQELGRPLERWGFVHGNWALSGSDDEICRIEGELGLLAEAGCFGDFTFPAGRAHCDPRTQAPFTCLAGARGRKVYDHPAAEPRAIGPRDGGLGAPGRFFIWNSVLKQRHCSIDWYHEPNLATFRDREGVVTAWLEQGVAYGSTLYLKTHAHSVNYRYRLWEDGQPIPHTHPDIVGAFDALLRVCDAGRIEFVPLTVNEVMQELAVMDAPEGRPAAPFLPAEAPVPPRAAPAVDLAAAAASRAAAANWATQLGPAPPPAPVERRPAPVEHRAAPAVAAYLRERWPAGALEVSVAGSPLLAAALAANGHLVAAFAPEGSEAATLATAAALPEVGGRLRSVPGRFPDALDWSGLEGASLLVLQLPAAASELVERMLRAAAAFDHVILLPPQGDDVEAWAALGRLRLVARIGPGGQALHYAGPQLPGPADAPAVQATEPPPPAADPVLAAVEEAGRQVVEAWEALPADPAAPPDALYEAKLRAGHFIEPYEAMLAAFLLEQYPDRAVRIAEIGAGQGGLCCLLGLLGFAVDAFEMNHARHIVAARLVAALSAGNPGFRPPRLRACAFPDGLEAGDLDRSRPSLLVATNIVNSFTAAHAGRILRAAGLFDRVLLDLGRFGTPRNEAADRAVLLRGLCARAFVPLTRLPFAAPHEYWLLAARPVLGGGSGA